jgi:hypothetical protein
MAMHISATHVLKAVYDSSRGWPADEADREPVLAWLKDHNISAADTYRIEVWVGPTYFAKVFQHATDEQNRMYCPIRHDHQARESCEIAQREPWCVPADGLPT